jgi:hypothetical protein
MKGATIIPTSFLPIIGPELDGAEPRRITLLHKNGTTLICALSRSIEEVSYDKPMEDSFILKMLDRDNVTLSYEQNITLRERKVGNKSYTLTETPLMLSEEKKKEKKKLPFLRSGEFISDIVQSGEGLDSKINDLLSISNEYITAYCEEIADHGLIRLLKSKKIKDVKERSKEIGAAIYDQVNGLFHEEHDEPRIKKHDLYVADRAVKDYFDDLRSTPKKITALVKSFALLGAASIIMPPSLPEVVEKTLRKKYEQRYESMTDENEKEAIALSEFALCNPKLISGIRRGYFEFKKVADITTFSLQLAANAYILSHWSPWLSIPLTIPTVLTGATMFRNAVRSGWQDYSGILATEIEKTIQKEIEKGKLF